MESIERDVIEADVLLVGAGPASLACAYQLARLFQARGEEREIVVLEKGKRVGEHILSGAVMDPSGLDALFDGKWREAGCPVEAQVAREAIYYLSATRKYRFPFVPPPLRNRGAYIVTLSRVVEWMRQQVEALGVNVFEGFPAAEILWDGECVVGARTVDLGVDSAGRPKEGFTPGTDVRAAVTVFGEGSRGSLTKVLVEKLGLGGRNPQIYATGIKEVWELPQGRVAAGHVIHTAGWPLSSRHYGGGWIYGMEDGRVSMGFVPALDYAHPRFNPWDSAQIWKTHPWIRDLLRDGKLLQAGAKTVPEGGFWSQPKLYGDGFVIVGDGASFLNAPRLKGIHSAILSGKFAAEAISSAVSQERHDSEALAPYAQRYRASAVYRELRRARNMRQAFSKSFFFGMAHAGALYLAGGRLLRDPLPVRADAAHMRKLAEFEENPPPPPGELVAPDGETTFDRATGVFHAGAMHDEDQPSHLLVGDLDICRTRCREEYGNPCETFCPAHVYEMVETPEAPGGPGSGGPGSDRPGRHLEIRHSNCVHCKTCDIMDPYGIITWQVPHDAGGPNYQGM